MTTPELDTASANPASALNIDELIALADQDNVAINAAIDPGGDMAAQDLGPGGAAVYVSAADRAQIAYTAQRNGIWELEHDNLDAAEGFLAQAHDLGVMEVRGLLAMCRRQLRGETAAEQVGPSGDLGDAGDAAMEPNGTVSVRTSAEETPIFSEMGGQVIYDDADQPRIKVASVLFLTPHGDERAATNDFQFALQDDDSCAADLHGSVRQPTVFPGLSCVTATGMREGCVAERGRVNATAAADAFANAVMNARPTTWMGRIKRLFAVRGNPTYDLTTRGELPLSAPDVSFVGWIGPSHHIWIAVPLSDLHRAPADPLGEAACAAGPASPDPVDPRPWWAPRPLTPLVPGDTLTRRQHAIVDRHRPAVFGAWMVVVEHIAHGAEPHRELPSAPRISEV